MKQQVRLLNFDNSQYFGGYHLPTLPILIEPKQYTNKEMAELIKSEMNAVFEFLFFNFPKHEKLYKKYIKELLLSPNDIFCDFSNDTDLIEMAGTDEYDFYAYFSVTEIKYSNGIKFLS